MPFVNISTSVKVKDKTKLLEEITIIFSSLTNKSRKFVMTKIEDELIMHFDDDQPCCYLEIKSIGSLNSSGIAGPISDLIFKNIGIPINRIYIHFEDVPASMWGWNGSTFGK